MCMACINVTRGGAAKRKTRLAILCQVYDNSVGTYVHEKLGRDCIGYCDLTGFKVLTMTL